MAAALGLGVVGYAQAQEAEGVKAYIKAKFVDFRLVNPLGVDPDTGDQVGALTII